MEDGTVVQLDIPRILGILGRHQVQYVLFGSVGAMAYGAELTPGDLDICPAPDQENLRRLAQALEELGARPKVIPGWMTQAEAESWSPMPLTEENFDHLFETPFGDLDIVPRPYGPQGKLDSFTYERLNERAAIITTFGVSVRVADLEDLIASKMSRRRDKDLGAYPELQRIRGTAGDLDVQ